MNKSQCENEKFLQKILRDYEGNKKLIIEKISVKKGSNIGDNYMSIVNRVKVKGKLKPPKDYSTSLIIKRQIPSISRRILYRCDEAFENEINAYCHLIPVFRQFSNNCVPYPRLIYAGKDNNNEEVVMLEDLTKGNYEMLDRLKGLNYGECKIVMKELGNLHGISLAMKSIDSDKFQKAKNKIKEIIYCPEASHFYRASLESSLSEALSSLRNSNKDNILTNAIQKIEKLNGKLYDIIEKHVNDNNDDMWKVICHGDIWINNLMFKKCGKNKVAKQVKLIDLQAMRYASPILDLLHFLYTSTEWELRRDYLDQLILHYRTSLIESLRRYMINVNPTQFNKFELEFTADNIKNQLQLKSIYGLGTCMWLLPAITFHPDNIPDLDSVQMEHFTTKKQEELMTQMQTPEYHRRIKDVVLEFEKKGYLDRI